jgi:hypothetical protein
MAPSSPEFTTRLQTRFRIGSSVQALLDELHAEKFTISKDSRDSTATYERGGFVCKDTWSVTWTAENQKIASIYGGARKICL